MKKVSNLNVGLFIGGMVAEAIVDKVGVKLLASTLKHKFKILYS